MERHSCNITSRIEHLQPLSYYPRDSLVSQIHVNSLSEKKILRGPNLVDSCGKRQCLLVRSAAVEEPPDAEIIEAEVAEILEASAISIQPVSALRGYVLLPGSKSMTNRIVLLAALSEGISGIENVLDSEDTRHMAEALQQLGVNMTVDWNEKEMVVTGCRGRFPSKGADLYLGNAGTAMRPLTAAVAAAGRGKFVLDGVERMRERPIQDLVDGLVALGVDAECTLGTGCPPVKILAEGLKPGKITLNGRVSSQYLTALLMAAPLAVGEGATEILSEGLISQPYVEMTVELMRRFSIQVEELDGISHLRIPAGQKYKSKGKLFVEGDASSASYWLAGAALTGSEITVEGCGTESLQGDVAFALIMESMGAKTEWEPNKIKIQGPPRGSLSGGDFDCEDIPDAAMTLAVVAAMANSPSHIRNVGSWRVKETERMKAIVTELEKLGVEVKEHTDSLEIFPKTRGGKPDIKSGVEINTYNDHRMAMAFSLFACAGVEVTIMDPGCVRKTYPHYFSVFQALAVQ